MAPNAPAVPPNPTTEATAFCGNMSETVVKMLAENPWCAAAATPTNTTAIHLFGTMVENITGTTHKAQMNMAVLRAALTDQPRLSNAEDNQPPPMLPRSAST